MSAPAARPPPEQGRVGTGDGVLPAVPLVDAARQHRLLEAGRELVTTSDIDTILEHLLDTARELTDARYAAIGVLDPTRSILERFITRGIDERTRARIGDPPSGNGVLGELTHNLQPLRIDDVADHPASVGFPPGHPPMHTFLGVPIAIGGVAYGSLYLAERRGGTFDEADTEVAVVLADWAAIAIENERSIAVGRLRTSIEAAERERGNFARELHDETLQGLGALQIVLRRAAQGPEEQPLGELCEQALDLVREETHKLRAIISDLRPAALDQGGLEEALFELAHRSSTRSGLRIEMSVELEPDAGRTLDPENETAVYRIVEEALTNAGKHGRAERVDAQVAALDGIVMITVTDDGDGFDPEGANGGFGLLGMRERAELAGGELTVDSRPGDGTRVLAVIAANGLATDVP